MVFRKTGNFSDICVGVDVDVGSGVSSEDDVVILIFDHLSGEPGVLPLPAKYQPVVDCWRPGIGPVRYTVSSMPHTLNSLGVSEVWVLLFTVKIPKSWVWIDGVQDVQVVEVGSG